MIKLVNNIFATILILAAIFMFIDSIITGSEVLFIKSIVVFLVSLFWAFNSDKRGDNN